MGWQSWRDLLFIHWPVPADALRSLVPAALRIQEFGGSSWVGLVPFRMCNVRLRGTPPVPWLSGFPEINLRLYVEYKGRPGVWFVSLDAARAAAVWAARRFVFLPYFHARMSMELRDPEVRLSTTRLDDDSVAFEARYRPIGAPFAATSGTLEHFLTERYALYSQDPAGHLWTVDVHHVPWPLQPADADIVRNTILTGQHVPVPDVAPLLHFSRRLDVLTWGPRRAGSRATT